MGLLQDFLRKRKERVEERKGYERSIKIQEQTEAKTLSSNERELMRWQEEDRQKMIKAALDERKKRENDEIWNGQKGNPLNARNVTTGDKQLFGVDNMFAHQRNLFDGEENLFFKR